MSTIKDISDCLLLIFWNILYAILVVIIYFLWIDESSYVNFMQDYLIWESFYLLILYIRSL